MIDKKLKRLTKCRKLVDIRCRKLSQATLIFSFFLKNLLFFPTRAYSSWFEFVVLKMYKKSINFFKKFNLNYDNHFLMKNILGDEKYSSGSGELLVTFLKHFVGFPHKYGPPKNTNSQILNFTESILLILENILHHSSTYMFLTENRCCSSN